MLLSDVQSNAITLKMFYIFLNFHPSFLYILPLRYRKNDATIVAIGKKLRGQGYFSLENKVHARTNCVRVFSLATSWQNVALYDRCRVPKAGTKRRKYINFRKWTRIIDESWISKLRWNVRCIVISFHLLFSSYYYIPLNNIVFSIQVKI